MNTQGENKEWFTKEQLLDGLKKNRENSEKQKLSFVYRVQADVTYFNKTNMAKTKTKGFDVPKGFPIPLSKSVIIEKVKEEQKTVAGLILNESNSENNVGIIMAVAEDCNPLLKPGMKVMYNLMEDRTIRFEENYYLIMHELSVFCILPENAMLMPEKVNPKVKKREEWLVKEQQRLNNNYKKELNKVDEIMEKKKKIFSKKR